MNTAIAVPETGLFQRLSKDLRDAADTLDPNEVRFLVDYYYIAQEDRKRGRNQERALTASEEPHGIITWLANLSEEIEETLEAVLGRWAASKKPGAWAQSICGIANVLSAGLLAHIDIHRAPTAGNIWSFAGLTTGVVWLGTKKAGPVVKALVDGKERVTTTKLIEIAKKMGADPVWLSRCIFRQKTGSDIPFRGAAPQQAEPYISSLLGDLRVTAKDIMMAVSKRPWNAQLKTLAWKIGESFVKVRNNDKDFYGKHYVARKAIEIAANESGAYADQAAAKLQKFDIGQKTDAYLWYSGCLTPKDAQQIRDTDSSAREGVARKLAGKPGSGIPMLPPAHIHARAKRYAVKLFLSHFHEAMYRDAFGKAPPVPYIIEHGGHKDIIPMHDPEGIFG